ncbi:uncharacterized protein LOC135817249 isoform X3 [Sycon ciliatum]|uniref:uncharacterized protein LOC135817249 isoform X3 n=1 Tax=Sycon ciliatum TaxID=27933 RepID=UPI0031F708BB
MRHGVLRSCLALAVVASAVALPAIIPSRTENNEACAANEVYHECGTACPATCDNMNSGPRICPAMCVMGCFCTEGFVRASGENGAGCVRKETCTAPLASEEQTFVAEGQTQTERSDCGAHATYSDCGSACEATCGNSNTADQVCPDVCVSGCFCDPGYIRDTLVVNSPCVMEHMCLEPPAGVHTGVDTQDLAVEPPAQNGNQASSAACGLNEVFTECGTACPTACGVAAPLICTLQCVVGCFCQHGFVRESATDGARCISALECQAQQVDTPAPEIAPVGNFGLELPAEANTGVDTPQCSQNKVYQECGTACPATCGVSAPMMCTMQCVMGCFCQSGFVLESSANGAQCISHAECEARQATPPAVHLEDHIDLDLFDSSTHVDTPQCSQNKVYQECGTACPATCGVSAPMMCTMQCVMGCFCQSGFVLEFSADGAQCISHAECEARQSATQPPAPETAVATEAVCPSGEVYNECGTACPSTCTQPGPRPCAKICSRGCFCPEGFVRQSSENGAPCVQSHDCPANTQVDTPQCSQNEVYQECGTACPATCGVSGPRMCTMQCVMGCFCQSGFVLESSANGAQCISHAECEARQSATQPPAPETAVATEAVCPSGEVYNECGTACPSTCTQPGPRPCVKICSRGCFCPEGFVRQSSENGAPCVQSHDCPVLHEECPVGEVYQACGTACPSSCAHPGPRPCSRICSRGCFCPVGSVRQSEENGAPCVQASSCPVPTTSPPSTVGPNADVFIDHDLIFSVTRACSDPLEVFQTCGSACPATCNDTVPAVCSMQCVQGCFCAPGFVRSEAGGRCVPQVTCANKKATVDGSDCMTCNNEMYEPLCGNDGMSYPNLCALRREECLKNKAVQVSYKRQCRSPGCNLGDRAVFNSMLVRYIQKKMEASPPRPEPIAAAGQSGSAEPEPNISRVPFKKAIYWMFDELDVNPRDRRLGKREARAFLTELKSQIGLKGCASTMWASCDYNRDHHVSLSEWCYCTGLDSVCTPEKRTMFNEKILDHIKDLKAEKEQAEGSQPEPERNPNVPTAEPRLDSPAKELVYWMFDELDVAPYDRHLSQKETWRFVEGLETNVTQRACGSSLLEHCDCNNDQRIGLNEWCWCLGLDNTCPADRRQYFQQRMLEFMNKKKALAVPEPETEPSDDSSHEPYDPRAEPRLNTPAKQTIYWMFDELDVAPRDRKLSDRELTGFLAEAKCTVSPRACAESLQSYCDYNEDGFVSLHEWCWCSGLDNECTPENKNYFNANLLKRAAEWHAHLHPMIKNSGRAGGFAVMVPHRLSDQDLLFWLFRRLDTSPVDGHLTAAETHVFVANVSRNVGPRACALGMIGAMDTNDDGRINWVEWFRGLGIRMPPIGPPQETVEDVPSAGDAGDDSNGTCVYWRGYCCSTKWFCSTRDGQKAWQMQNPPISCPIPIGGKCQDAPKPGTGICQYWPLSGQCGFEMPEMNEESTCNDESRTVYQTHLLEYMTARRTEAGHTEPLPESDEPRDPTAEPRLKTPAKQTIYWMFDELDVAPMDRKLSRAEVGVFMNDTVRNVHPRACAESQWNYCDYNDDGSISLSEWCWCTGLDPTCPADKRQFFQHKMLQFIKKKRSQANVTPEPETTSDSSERDPAVEPRLNTPAKVAIYWQFDELDVSPMDRQLSENEISSFMSEVVREVDPRACAETLQEHCDYNKDGMISLSEWCWCSGLDNECSPEKERHFQANLLQFMSLKRQESGHVEPSPESESNPDPTAEPRLKTPAKITIYWMFDELDVAPMNRKLSRAEAGSFFSEVDREVGPRACAQDHWSRCDYNNDGSISLSEWCWCTGLDPTCPADKRTFYQHNLLNYMTMKRTEAGHTEPLPESDEPRDPTAEPRLKTPAKQTIYWMFDELDVAPMDRKLSRAEVGVFMNNTVRNVHPRACAESQWNYCDYNDDGSISLSEWCWCTGLDPTCPADKRQFFQHKMLQFIKKKRSEANVTPEPETTSDSSERDPAVEPRLNTPAKVAIYWQFDELDVAPMDRQLSENEISSFRSEVVREVDPRACAETLQEYCDYNKDGMISLSEWCWCSGLDNECSPEKERHFQANLVQFMSLKRQESGHVEPSPEPESTPDPTAEPRLKTPAKITIYWMFDELDVAPMNRKLSRAEAGSFFSEVDREVGPRACAQDHWSRCDYNNDGSISLSEWCWCTGLDPTCPADKRTFYQHNLLNYMTMKRTEAGHTEPLPESDEPRDPTAEPRLKTPAKQTIYWMFDELDVAPMDRKLSRAEVGVFMNNTVRNVHPRACAESQWNYCDYNDDGSISLSEWCWCTGLDPTCPADKRQFFQHKMLQFIKKKRSQANVTPEPEATSDNSERDPAVEPRLNTPAKVAIYWQFDELDVSPMDRQLSENEMSSFMSEVVREVDPRACAETLQEYCDYNDDGMISLSEWCWCSGLDNECSPEKERHFQANLLQFMSLKRQESGHVEPSPEPDSTPDPTAEPRLKTPAKITVYWMFDELDVAPMDRKLSRTEAGSFFSEVDREVGPRACAQDHWSRCDYNNDGSISLSEWCSCTGLDPSGGNDTGGCVSWPGYCCGSRDWHCGTPGQRQVWYRTHIPPPCPPPPPPGCIPVPRPGTGVCQYWPLADQCAFQLPLTADDDVVVDSVSSSNDVSDTNSQSSDPVCEEWRGWCCANNWYCKTHDEYTAWFMTHPPPPCPMPPGGQCPNATKPGTGMCQYWPLSGQCGYTMPETDVCNDESRTVYQTQLLEYMTARRTEAGHTEPLPESDEPRDPTAEPRLKTPAKQTIYWMFDELDVAPMDRKLSRAEVGVFMNDTVRNVHPRACAESQWNYCDYNDDGSISLSEWCWCTGLDPTCPADKRQFFQHKMLQFIKKKRSEANVTPEPETTSDNSEHDPAVEPRLNTPAKVAIYWQFDELDVSPMDRQLSENEMSSFRSEVVREVDPRACAETLQEYCDYNKDGMISLSEWCWCSGLDNECSPEKERHFQANLLQFMSLKRQESGHVEPSPELESNPDPTAEPRLKTPAKITIYWMFDELDVAPMNRKLSRAEAGSFFSEVDREVGPRACAQDHWSRCDYNNDGSISLSEWCWCTGLDPTCPADKRTFYQHNLLNYMTMKRTEAGHTEPLPESDEPRDPTAEPRLKTPAKQTIYWMFDELDVAPMDRKLSRAEVGVFMNNTVRNVHPRACAESQWNYCDYNDDGSISLSEWCWCTGLDPTCPADKRQFFQHRMLQFIKKKRSQANVTPEPETASDSSDRDPAVEPRLNTPAKVAIYWQFDELDVAPMDRQLSENEMSSFMSEVVREVDPRACAETLQEYCDYNDDGMISLSEWCWCSGLDNECSPEKERHFQANLLQFMSLKRQESGHVEPSPEPDSTPDPTAEPRLKTPAKITIYWMFDELDVAPMNRKLSRAEAGSFFSEVDREVGPRACAQDHWSRCDYNNDGSISLSEWCWCTGLDPTCPANKRTFYQHNLLNYMTMKRTEAGHTEPLPESDEPRDPTAEPRLKTPAKQTIYWMFDELDVAPMDRKLSRAEVGVFMNNTVRNVHPRACAESQWNYCDYNDDGSISLSEWCWCTGLDPTCPADKRQFFQHKMLQFIKKKRSQANVTPEPETTSDSSERDPAVEPRLNTPAKVAIYWQFDELDVAPMDRQLSENEISSFRSEVVREVDPRACAETLQEYCDHNKDGMISLSEWCWCSGLDNECSPEKERHFQANLLQFMSLKRQESGHVEPSPEPESNPDPTAEPRLKTPAKITIYWMFDELDVAPMDRKLSRAEAGSFFSEVDREVGPHACAQDHWSRCDYNNDGSISLSEWCWCTGLDPTCPADKRTFYQHNLLNYMTARRTEAGHTEPLPESDEPRDPTAEPRLKTPAKQTIYWMFDELDVAPMDRKLSRAEVGVFMNNTVRNVHPRACAESQWNYCDYNDDGSISLSEWCWCTGLDPTCPADKRQFFQHKMLQFIKKKRSEANVIPEPEATSDNSERDPAVEPRLNTPAKVAIYWQFDELDVSPMDRQLSENEISSFMSEVVREVDPRACAETLQEYCDYNKDGMISLSEWCWCSGLDNECSPDKESHFQANLLQFMSSKRQESGHVEPSPEPDSTPDPTAEPRLKTPAKITIYWMFDELDVAPTDRKLSRAEAGSFFSEVDREVGPRACAVKHWDRCDYNQDGAISLSEWCWCTGLDPTCPARKRIFYQHNTLEYMSMKRAEAGHVEPSPSTGEPSNPSAEPRMNTPAKITIYWMFDELDVAPMDRKLSRAEVGAFMNETVRNVHPRACAESQWTYCDYDDDDYISLSEWCWCNGLDNQCTPEKETQFQSRLVTYISDMRQEAGHVEPSPEEPNQVTDPQAEPRLTTPAKVAIYWMFDELDVSPMDRTLSHSEADAFFSIMQRSVGPRACALEHWSRCDYNNNGNISLMEWCWCTGLDPVCTPEKRTYFNNNFLAHVRSWREQDPYIQRPEGVTPFPEPSAEPRLATPAKELVYWAFDKLDTAPYDRFLELHEVEWFDVNLSENVGPRACADNFLEYCDANADQRISLHEWCDCTGYERPN